MKRFWVLLMALVLAVCLIAGCGDGVKTYADPEKTISIKIEQEFIIALDSNPTTPYDWKGSYDESMLKLVESKYEPGKQAKQGLVGAGGTQYFRFKASKTGRTEITFVYKRPWEELTPQDVTRVFTVDIR